MSDEWVTWPEGPRDADAIRDIVLAAFGRPDEARLVDDLRRDAAWIGQLSVLAGPHDGEPVAHALLTRCHIGEAPALCLAPCAVHPGWQRRGAGGAAIRAALVTAAAMGEGPVVVLGHAGYYPRFGFTRAHEFGIRAPMEVNVDSLMARDLRGERPPAGVIRYAAPFGL